MEFSGVSGIRTYGIQLWGFDSSTNIQAPERHQSKLLRTMAGCPAVHRKPSNNQIAGNTESDKTPCSFTQKYANAWQTLGSSAYERRGQNTGA